MNLERQFHKEDEELSRRLFKHADFKGGSGGGGTTTTTQAPPPQLQFSDLKTGTDQPALDAFFDTFQQAEEGFLARTEPERGELRLASQAFDPALLNINQALSGNLTAATNPLVARATGENLSQQSAALSRIDEQLAAGNVGASFFGERLKSQAKNAFGVARANIVPDMINQIIAKQAGLAQLGLVSKGNLLGTRTNIISDAANFAQGFNPPSRVKTQNLAELARSSQGGVTTTTSSGGSKGGGLGNALGQIGAAAINVGF